jgi:hypothetical protein
MTASQTPAGWYADPHDPSRLRWWDGAAWTQQTAPAQPQPAQPQPAQAQPAGGASGALWTAQTRWVEAKARVGGWSAQVRDESGAIAGSVRQAGWAITLFDGAGAPQLQVQTERQKRHWGWSGVLGFDVLHPSGSPYGELDVTKYFNKRVTLSLRSAGQELAVLSPEDKSDDRFAVHDAAGTCVARIHNAQQSGSLFKQDITWWLSISRPLDQPLDALVLAAGTALNGIQHVVVNLHDVDVR